MDDVFLQKVMEHNLDFMDDTPTTLRAMANTPSKLDKLFVAFVNYLIEDGWRYHPGNLFEGYDCCDLLEDGMGKSGNCVVVALTFARLAMQAGVPKDRVSVPQRRKPFLTPRIGSNTGGVHKVMGTPFVFSIFDGQTSSGNVLEIDTRSRTVPVTTGRYIFFAEHAIARIDLGDAVLCYDPLLVARYLNGINDAVGLAFTAQARRGVFKPAQDDVLMVYTGQTTTSGALSKYALVEPVARKDVIAYCNWCKTRGRQHSLPQILLTELNIQQHDLA